MSNHIVPLRVYFTIFAALMVLTAVTVWVAFMDLGTIWGPLNSVIALSIATLKATLVVLFFMHVRYSSRLTALAIAAGLFWLAIFIALTMNDYLSRAWLSTPGFSWPAQ
jgi:cytochrome c oxidase subunit 4